MAKHPAVWSADDVAARFHEAVVTGRRLPPVRVQGYFNQGIDWVTLPGKLTLNTFAELRYRFRENNKDFYNAYGPAVGVEFRRTPFHLGVDYYWERFPELSDSSNRFRYYLSWYYDWDLKR